MIFANNLTNFLFQFAIIGSNEECKEELSKFAASIKTVQQMVKVAVVRASQTQSDTAQKLGADTERLHNEPCNLQVNKHSCS